MVAIGQNFLRPVLSRNDDKRIVGIEYIVDRNRFLTRVPLNVREFEISLDRGLYLTRLHLAGQEILRLG